MWNWVICVGTGWYLVSFPDSDGINRIERVIGM